MKELGAFLVAPIPAAVIGGLVSAATGGFPRPVSVILFYLLLLYALQLVFGLAIRSYLVRHGKVSAAHFVLGGTFMIAVPVIPYMLWALSNRPDELTSWAIVLVLWLLLGGITGLVYWVLGLRKPAASDS